MAGFVTCHLNARGNELVMLARQKSSAWHLRGVKERCGSGVGRPHSGSEMLRDGLGSNVRVRFSEHIGCSIPPPETALNARLGAVPTSVGGLPHRDLKPPFCGPGVAPLGRTLISQTYALNPLVSGVLVESIMNLLDSATVFRSFSPASGRSPAQSGKGL